MMTDIQAVAVSVGVEVTEIHGWIEAGWLLPSSTEGGWRFAPADVARLRLIVELRRDLLIGDEALPVILALLDQIYGLRRDLKALARAVGEQPEATRTAIAEAVKRRPPGG